MCIAEFSLNIKVSLRCDSLIGFSEPDEVCGGNEKILSVCGTFFFFPLPQTFSFKIVVSNYCLRHPGACGLENGGVL